jgi:hypothetical protein
MVSHIDIAYFNLAVQAPRSPTIPLIGQNTQPAVGFLSFSFLALVGSSLMDNEVRNFLRSCRAIMLEVISGPRILKMDPFSNPGNDDQWRGQLPLDRKCLQIRISSTSRETKLRTNAHRTDKFNWPKS